MGFFNKLFGSPGGSDGGKPKKAARRGGNEPGKSVEELARRLGMSVEALLAVPIAFREVQIPKKSGKKRTLYVPEEPLKKLQRTILRRLLGRLAAHPCAMGFERGQSIATNAAVHVGASVVLKMDFRDFFSTTSDDYVRAYLIKIGWGGEAADLLVKLTTYKGGLPQGAPTSPRLSNLVNYGLDARLFSLGLKLGAKYTRYADDIAFSFIQQTAARDEREMVAQLIQATKRIADDFGYSVHQAKKLRICRRHERMVVTGVVVNDHLNLPRTTRRRIRAVAHHLKTGKPATMTQAQLNGWRAFESMVIAKRTAPPTPPPSSHPA